MANTNLVVPQNVEGNIGSCGTSKITVTESRDLWLIYKQDITTNSCTGEVNRFNYWDLAPQSVGICFVGAIILVIVVTGIASIFTK